jgi:hypothetical protein
MSKLAIIYQEWIFLLFWDFEMTALLSEKNKMKTFMLTARISTENPKAIKLALKQLPPKASVSAADEGFLVKAKMQGDTAKDLNRNLLSSLRCGTRKPSCAQNGSQKAKQSVFLITFLRDQISIHGNCYTVICCFYC